MCPYHLNPFPCITASVSSVWTCLLPSTSHILLIILILAYWSVILFSFFTGQVSLPCNIQLYTQPLHLIRSEMPLLVSRGTSCLNSFNLFWTIACMAASASPSTFSMSLMPQDLSTNSRLAPIPVSMPHVGPGQSFLPSLSLHFPTSPPSIHLVCTFFAYLLASSMFLLFHLFPFYQNNSTTFPGRMS